MLLAISWGGFGMPQTSPALAAAAQPPLQAPVTCHPGLVNCWVFLMGQRYFEPLAMQSASGLPL